MKSKNMKMGIGLFLIFLGITLLLIGIFLSSFHNLGNWGEILAIGGVVVICIGFIIGTVAIDEIRAKKVAEREEIIEEVQEDVENGYKMYIDGREVDIDDIILDDYNITIKDDSKKIILSN